MSGIQLRRYEIRPGEMDEFVQAWRRLVSVRERFGFRVLFAFASPEGGEFTWAVAHDGDFEQAERAYYEDAEAGEIRADVIPHLAETHVALVRDVLG